MEYNHHIGKVTNVELAAKSKVVKVLCERINLARIDLLLSSDEIEDGLRMQLEKYMKNKKADGLIEVQYAYSNLLKNKGRLYAKSSLSLQGIKRSVRHFISGEYYYDIDMSNAHPVLLEQYCTKRDIDCTNLTYYVENREEILTEIMNQHEIDRYEAKRLMLRQMYLGSYAYNKDGVEVKPKERVEFLVEFKKELVNITKNISKRLKNLYKMINDEESITNKDASFLSHHCQILENNCLLAMYDYLEENHIEIGVLCFDGIMISRKFKGDLKKMMKDCSDNVFSKTGYRIKLEEKKMDEPLNIKLPEFSNYVLNDKDCAEKLLKIMGEDNIRQYKGDFYVYDEKDGIYHVDDKKDSPIITAYLMKHSKYLNIKDKTGPESNYGESTSLMKRIPYILRSICRDDEWLRKVENSSLGYLLFKDGVYDFTEGRFRPELKNDPNIVFFSRVPHNFPERNEENIKYAMDISFNKIQDNPTPLIRAMSAALAGKLDRKINIGPGKQANGKSGLLQCAQVCFGSYVGTFSLECFARKKMSSTDEAAQLRWSYIARHCRILISSEVNMASKLDGNMMKKFSSGGDTIVARSHYGVETEFVPHFTCFSFLNDLAKIEPLDKALIGRLEFFEFKYKFVSKDRVGEKPHYREQDPNFIKTINTEKFISGFIHILLDGYKDYIREGIEYDKQAKKKWLDGSKDGENLSDLLVNKFDFTASSNDRVSVGDMKKFYNANKKTIGKMSYTKFIESVTKKGAEKGKSGSSRYFKFIKPKATDFLDNNDD